MTSPGPGPEGFPALPWLAIGLAILVAAAMGIAVHLGVTWATRRMASRPGRSAAAAALDRQRRPLVAAYACTALLAGLRLIDLVPAVRQPLTPLLLVSLAAALLWTMFAARSALS